MARTRVDGLWVKNAAGLYVLAEPISAPLVVAATTNDIPRVKADDTLEFATLTAGTDITVTHGAGTITIASTASGSGGGGTGDFMVGKTSPGTEGDHFDSSTLDAKWSVTSDMASYDVNTSVTSAFACVASGAQALTLDQAVTHAGDVAYTARFALNLRANFQQVNIGLFDATFAAGVRAAYAYNSGSFQVSSSTRTASVDTFNVATDNIPERTHICLHIQRVGTTWTMGWGDTPWAIIPLATLSKTMTIGQLRIEMTQGGATVSGRYACDYVLRDFTAV